MTNPNNHILLVEDELVVAEAARRILSVEGFHVDMAQSAEGAFDKLDKNQYQLILSDLMLPGKSGIEVIEYARKLNATIPIIIITGYASHANAVKIFRTGAFDCIPKPFDFEELAGVIFRAKKFSERATETQSSLQLQNDAQQNSEGAPYYLLGQHSWTKLNSDGICTLGLGETFAGCMGTINSIEFPLVNNEISQGNLCVRIISEDYLNHMVWAPLGGKIVALNKRLEREMDKLNTSPYHDGWLIQVVPTNLEKDLNNLSLRRI
ncbi:MAG: response regulator [Candidatus Zhuqueibacterota bacterium]